jgi:hypothetical protein
MDDEDNYFSKECHIGANRIKSYVTEQLPIDNKDDYLSKECSIGANRIKSYITEGILMDNKDDYCSKECRIGDNRIKSYITEQILPLPPVELKGFQHLYKSTKTTSKQPVLASHKATIKHGLPHNDHARRRD